MTGQTETGPPILALPGSTLHGEIKPGPPGFDSRATMVDPETSEGLPGGQKGVLACERLETAPGRSEHA